MGYRKDTSYIKDIFMCPFCDTTKLSVQVTGRQVIYLQPVGKDGKVGKPVPYVASTVLAQPIVKTKKNRKNKK